MRRVFCSFPRPSGLPLVLALVVSGLFVLGVAGPAGAAPAASSFVQCTDLGNGIYIQAGGALLHVSSWGEYGYDGTLGDGTAEPSHTTATITANASCKTLATKTPATGTYVRAVVASSASPGWTYTGSTYLIVGGVPVAVTAASTGVTPPASPVPVSAAVLTSLSAPDACPTTVAGCLYNKVAGGAQFRSGANYYRTDSASHPYPQATGSASWAAVPAAMLSTCANLNCDPIGTIVTSSSSYGVLHLEGYAMDFPAATPVNVQLLVDQTSTYTLAANLPSAYAPAGTAGNHGFAWDLRIAAGAHEVCATVLGSTPGATTQQLGCSYPTVIGAKPGRVKKVRLKALGHGKVRVKWKRVAANGNPITTYMLKCGGGHAKQLSGAKTQKVLKHQHRGRRLSCKVRAVSGGSSGGYGKWSKASKSVTVK